MGYLASELSVIPEIRDESPKQRFYTLKSIFERCYSELFQANNIALDPKMAAGILATEHGLSSFYEDTELFMKAVSQNNPLCLVSDSDKDMIIPLLKRLQFDKVFISEEMNSYKIQPENKIFLGVVKYFGVKPQEILHIGDSYADIIGANRIGIKTCWLNRTNKKWNYQIEPDYEVNSLLDVVEILRNKKISNTA